MNIVFNTSLHILSCSNYYWFIYYSRPQWFATVAANDCAGSVSSSNCELQFSFCQRLPNGICFDSVFCQPGDSTVSFGKFTETLKISEGTHLVDTYWYIYSV